MRWTTPRSNVAEHERVLAERDRLAEEMERMAAPIVQIAHLVRHIEACDREIGRLNATSAAKFGHIRIVLSGGAPAITTLFQDALVWDTFIAVAGLQRPSAADRQRYRCPLAASVGPWRGNLTDGVPSSHQRHEGCSTCTGSDKHQARIDRPVDKRRASHPLTQVAFKRAHSSSQPRLAQAFEHCRSRPAPPILTLAPATGLPRLRTRCGPNKRV